MSDLSTKCSDSKAVVLDAFDASFASPSITLSPDGCFARLSDPSDARSHGVVCGNAPLQVFFGEAFFEVRVEANAVAAAAAKAVDGLTVGVSLRPPAEFFWTGASAPGFADEVPESWSIGYDGCYCRSGEMANISWSPTELLVGDEVGVLVTREGELHLLKNGERRATAPDRVPIGVPLYAIVNLMGCTTAVSLIPGANPPRADDIHEDGISSSGSDAEANDVEEDVALDNVGVPAHTMQMEEDAEAWLREDQALRHRDAGRLARLRAERCLSSLAWTVGRCAGSSVIPFGSLASASMVYAEMDAILRKFGIPMTVQDSMWQPKSPTMRAIQKSVAQLCVAGAAAVTGSLSTNALYAIPVFGIAAATVAGPMICGSTSFAVLTRFVDDLQPIVEDYYYLQWYPLQHPWQLASLRGLPGSKGGARSSQGSGSEVWVDGRSTDDGAYTF